MEHRVSKSQTARIFSGPVRCFVVNMPSAADRREQITRQLNSLDYPFEFFPAVDGRALSAEEIEINYDRKRALRESTGLTLPEIGCALSHIGIYRKMVDEGIGHALILEDDARLEPVVPAMVEKLREHYVEGQPAVVLLSHVPKYLKRDSVALAENRVLVNPYGSCSGAYGYFITLAGARVLSRELWPVWVVSDHWLKIHEWRMVSIKAVVPDCIKPHELGEKSLIGQRGQQEPHNRKTMGRFCRKYLHGELWWYLFRRMRNLCFKLRVRMFDVVLTQ
ncbi:MAG: glycosyltransferase family 25 protein [Verrucomicrobiales bacterium]|jgi:glycosyl transferase family 25|nr:glycosyltransferase family 25 protein [Verrucomicrobiales bacterium]